MYPITIDHYYKLYAIGQARYIEYFYSDTELIIYIAKNYSSFLDGNNKIYNNFFLDNCKCNAQETDFNSFMLFDNYDRIINPRDFANDALDLFNYWERNTYPEIKTKRVRDNNYAYRESPVPGTGKKRRGGSPLRTPRTAQMRRVYSNPEYKTFNRSSFTSLYSVSYWDDSILRPTYRSWKHQSKARHQWQRGTY